MPKMKPYDSYAAWRSDQSEANQQRIGWLERAILAVSPHLQTTVKWGQGCFVDGSTPKIYLHAEADLMQLGFYAGSRLDDPDGLLEGRGKYVRHVKVRTEADVTESVSALIGQV